MTNKIEKNNSQKDYEIDLKVLFKFLFRNKLIISTASVALFIFSFIFSSSLKKVWQGELQIVLSEDKNQSLSLLQEASLQNLLEVGDDNLKTQVEILKSPSVLLPIFEFVSSEKKLLDNKSEINFIGWKKNLKIELVKNTSVLDVSYRDTDKKLIVPVLEKISEAYQDYSGKNEKRKQSVLKDYLENQISLFKEKSFNSLRNAQDYAIDQNLIFLESSNAGLNLEKDPNSNSNSNANSILLIPNIGLETIRANAVNEIKRIDSQLKKINEMGEDYEQLKYLGSTIPGLVEEGLPAQLATIEKKLLLKSNIYQESDRSIKSIIENRDLIVKLLKDRAIGYLEAKKTKLQSIIEAAMRPKDVLLKYKELLREASRDEKTLITLENNYRFIQLEEAKKNDPWQLVTNPTLLKDKVAPSRLKISLQGLIAGFIFSTLFASYKEKKSGKIYDITNLENFLSISIIEQLFLKGNNFENNNLNFLRNYINLQKVQNINFICCNESNLNIIENLKKVLENRKLNKEFFILNPFNEINNVPLGKNFLIVDIDFVKYPDISKMSKYLNVLKINLDGVITFKKID